MKTSIYLAAALTVGSLFASNAFAAPQVYQLDPTHTSPSFAADHMGGVSIWRGKFSGGTGSVTLDPVAKTGSADIKIDISTVETGNTKLDEHLKNPDFFDAAKYPTAEYKGTQIVYKGDKPSEMIGTLTMHGVTQPLDLKIDSFKCIMHPVFKRQVCGAEASAHFDRSDYGIDWGKKYGFLMKTSLRIQVEGIAQ